VEGCEYAIDGGEWGSTFEFTGLTENTEYSFTQRYAETSTHNASETSEALLASTEAAPINVLTGTVTITGTLQFDEELTAEVSDDNNTGILSYQWKRDDSDINGATAQTYTLVEADIATSISVEVSSTIETGNISCSTNATVEKANQNTPDAPTLASKTHNSITLNELEGCEYAIDGGIWQTTTVFNGLAEDTEYDLIQRYAETSTHNASIASSELLVTTETSSGVPTEVSIEDEIFNSSSTECYGATQSIVVAENGNQVLFQNGSNINLIAGQSIRFMPGTVIEPGAYVHAYITSDNTFCEAIESSNIVSNNYINTKALELEPSEQPVNDELLSPSLKVFPNPNNGTFTVQTSNFVEQTTIQIFDNTGRIVYTTTTNNNKTEFVLNELKQGLYFIRTINNNTSLTQRIIIK
jgi:hypothetical protein